MQCKKYKEELIRVGINFSLLLVFWGGMLRKNFNSDTIYHMLSGDADIFSRIEAGRYMVAFFDYILLKLGGRVTDNLSISMLVAFFMFLGAMIVIQKTFSRWEPEELAGKIGYNFVLVLVFFNVLFAEVLMFGEYSIYFGLGYLLAAAGVKRYADRKYASMLLLFAMAVCTYQFTMIYAAILVTVYGCLEHDEKLSMEAVKRELIGIVAAMGMGAANYISIKILEKAGIVRAFGKHAGTGNIGKKALAMTESFIELHKNSLGILPNLWIPFLFTLGVTVLLIYSCVKRQVVKKLLFIVIAFVGSLLLLYVIPVLQETFSFPPRMAFCFYLVQGLLAVTAYVVCLDKVRWLLSLGCIGYMLVQLLFCDFVVTNRFISNTLDEVYVNMMYQEVLKYEKETGTEVTQICVVKDAYAPAHYEEVSYGAHQINERVLGTITISFIGHVTGRHFKKVKCDEEIYDQYFKDKDWNYLDLSEQLIFQGDTVYWCIF